MEFKYQGQDTGGTFEAIELLVNKAGTEVVERAPSLKKDVTITKV